MKADDLRAHMTATYFTLRTGLAVTALLFPLLLFGLGRRAGVSLLSSMSAYYHEAATRNVFVGVLFAIGFGLWAYKGFRRIENWALNAAGVFALGIALVPTSLCRGQDCPRYTLHGTFAVLFFVCIAYVAIFRAVDTIRLLEQKKGANAAAWFRAAYRVLGVAMVGLPGAAAIVSTVLQRGDEESTRVFWIEFAAVYAFAAYWIVKSIEISITQAERRAVRGELATETVPPAKDRTAVLQPFIERPIVSSRLPDAATG